MQWGGWEGQGAEMAESTESPITREGKGKERKGEERRIRANETELFIEMKKTKDKGKVSTDILRGVCVLALYLLYLRLYVFCRSFYIYMVS